MNSLKFQTAYRVQLRHFRVSIINVYTIYELNSFFGICDNCKFPPGSSK